MADQNALNMAELQLMKSGVRTAYMEDLYNQYITGVGGKKRIEIETLEPRQFPLATLLMGKANAGMNQFAMPNGKTWWFGWGEDATSSTPLDRKVVTDKVATSSTVGSTVTLDIVSTAGIKAGDILLGYGDESATPSTDEGKKAYFLVDSITDGTTAVLRRINVASFSVKKGQKLYVVGSAYAETADPSDPMYNTIVTKYGEAQIFKNSFSLSRRQGGFDNAYGTEMYFQMEKLARDHKFQIEMALLEGYRPAGFAMPDTVANAATDGSGRPVTYTMGLDQAIGLATDKFLGGGTANARKIVWTRGNSNIVDFETTMDNLFEYKSGGSGNKYMFGGLGVKSYLRSLTRDNKIQIMSSNSTTLGIIVNKVETDAGVLTFIEHPLMKGRFSNKFYIIDPALVETCVIAPTALHEQKKGYNSEVKHMEYITDLGLAVKQLPLHASGVILG